MPYWLGLAGRIYGASALVLGGAFVYYAWAVLRDRQDRFGNSLSEDAPARLAFRYSLLYLFVLFGALAIDRLV